MTVNELINLLQTIPNEERNNDFLILGYNYNCDMKTYYSHNFYSLDLQKECLKRFYMNNEKNIYKTYYFIEAKQEIKED